MIDMLKNIALIVEKDIKVEIRTQFVILRLLSFSLSLIFVFYFVMEMEKGINVGISIGILWLIFIFTAVLGINRSISGETSLDVYRSVFLSPISKSEFLFGKVISGCVFVFCSEVIITAIYHLLFNVNVLNGLFVIISLLGTFGIITLGCLLSFVSITTSNREMLLSILLFPLVLPIIIPCVKASIFALSQPPLLSDANFWLLWIIAYDLIIMAMVFLLVDYIE